MPTTLLPVTVIEEAVRLACRAPSYHNSQPWRWVVQSGTVSLFIDPDHLVASDADAGRPCSAAASPWIISGWPWRPQAMPATSIAIPTPDDHHRIATSA